MQWSVFECRFVAALCFCDCEHFKVKAPTDQMHQDEHSEKDSDYSSPFVLFFAHGFVSEKFGYPQDWECKSFDSKQVLSGNSKHRQIQKEASQILVADQEKAKDAKEFACS